MTVFPHHEYSTAYLISVVYNLFFYFSNIQSFCGYIKQLPSLEQNHARKKPSTRRDKDGDDMLVDHFYNLTPI